MNKKYIFFLTICISLLISGCGKVDKKIINKNNEFAFNLLQEITTKNQKDNNVFVSPLSISLILSMTLNGAKENTYSEISETLKVNNIDIKELNQSQSALLDELNSSNTGVVLSIANSIWAKENTKFIPDFENICRNCYKSEVRSSLDVKEINKFVKDHTNGKIEKIIDNIKWNTSAILINVIYFNGSWEKPFEKAINDTFYFSNKDKKELAPTGENVFIDSLPEKGNFKDQEMMFIYETFKYYEDDKIQAIELPYKGNRISMYIFLPKIGTEIDTLKKDLNTDNLNRWIGSMKSSKGTIGIPKFQMTYEIDMKQSLISLGIKDGFNEGKANFDKMCNEKIYIDKFFHKTFLNVNETGTEAGAVANEEMAALGVEPTPGFRMTVNIPFFFIITDNETKVIIFMGIIMKP